MVAIEKGSAPSEALKPQIHSTQQLRSLLTRRELCRGLIAGMVMGHFPRIVHSDEPKESHPAIPATKKEGKLVIVGGSNRLPDGTYRTEIEDYFMELVEQAGGEEASVAVIPTLSALAEELDADSFFRPKKRPVSLKKVHTRSRDTANTSSFTEPIRNATGVWVGGGGQHRWKDAYAGTLLEKDLHDILGRGGVVAGTSAGAAILCEEAIIGGDPAEIGPGIGIVRGGIVDMHLDRGRLGRLLKVVESRKRTGIGIDSDTALIIEGTRKALVMGIGNVRICFTTANGKQKVEVLSAGDTIDLSALKIDIAPHTKNPLSEDAVAGMP